MPQLRLLKNSADMKVIKITALIFTAVLLSACTKNDKGVEQLNSIESRWDDAISLAGSTPRIQLANSVSNLQELKNELNATEVSDCLAPAKGKFSKYMDNNIQVFLDFMRDVDNDSSYKYKTENEKLITEYFKIKEECTKK